MELETQISTFLDKQDDWVSAKDIISGLKLNVRKDKKRINSCLYSGQKKDIFKRQDGTPPLWRSHPFKGRIEDETSEEGRTIIFIDVDNSPCLKKAEPYAKDSIFIEAYASPAYNHHKPHNTPNLKFEHLDSGDNLPSAADVLFGMSMTEHCVKAADPSDLYFIIVSKDKLLKTQAFMHNKRYGCDYVIIEKGWNELREYLE